MIEGIKKFLSSALAPADAPPVTPTDPDADLRVAACALLLELAHADDSFTDDERRQIENAVERHFGLTPEEGRELIAHAEESRKKAIDLHQFTHLVTQRYDEGQRAVLAEIMWRVVYADGELSHSEEALLRKLGSLLDLKPGYLARARKRAIPENDSPDAPGGGA
jgi:uncharacterized tellurite resistance protein B-like protein